MEEICEEYGEKYKRMRNHFEKRRKGGKILISAYA